MKKKAAVKIFVVKKVFQTSVQLCCKKKGSSVATLKHYCFNHVFFKQKSLMT